MRYWLTLNWTIRCRIFLQPTAPTAARGRTLPLKAWTLRMVALVVRSPLPASTLASLAAESTPSSHFRTRTRRSTTRRVTSCASAASTRAGRRPRWASGPGRCTSFASVIWCSTASKTPSPWARSDHWLNFFPLPFCRYHWFSLQANGKLGKHYTVSDHYRGMISLPV